MPPKTDYEKLVNEMLDGNINNYVNMPDYILNTMKTFMSIPGMSDIFNSYIKNSVASDDNKINLKTFYSKVKQLFMELLEYYKFNSEFYILNENGWNPDNPKDFLPIIIKFDLDIEDLNVELANINKIVDKTGTKLENLTIEDFQYLNKLHKKYKGIKNL